MQYWAILDHVFEKKSVMKTGPDPTFFFFEGLPNASTWK